MLSQMSLLFYAKFVIQVCWIIMYHLLNPSAWEYQSAALDCIYHAARQSGAAGGDILDITQW